VFVAVIFKRAMMVNQRHQRITVVDL